MPLYAWATSYLLSKGIGVEWDGVTAGEATWWPEPLSLVITGDSVFTVLDDDVAGLKENERYWFDEHSCVFKLQDEPVRRNSSRKLVSLRGFSPVPTTNLAINIILQFLVNNGQSTHFPVCSVSSWRCSHSTKRNVHIINFTIKNHFGFEVVKIFPLPFRSLNHTERKGFILTVKGALAADGTSLLWEKPRWGGMDLEPLFSTRLAVVGTLEEGGAAALGRPREGDGVALGKPKDGEGKLGSDTPDGKLLMCSLFTGPREKMLLIYHADFPRLTCT